MDHPDAAAFREDHGFFSDFLCGSAKRMLMCDVTSPDEVDFQRNPTGLYIAVHTKNWALAIDRAGSYPAEAGIWVVRLDDVKSTPTDAVMTSPRANKQIPTPTHATPGQRVVRWRMLPLHAAVLFGAPIPVIKALVKANINACACQDDQGMTPLHLAFRAGSNEEVVVTLLSACPESIEVVDYKGRMPSMLVPKHTMSYADTIAEAFIRGPSQYYWSARVSGADRVRTQTEMTAKMKKLEEDSRQQLQMSERILDETQQELTEEIEALSVENIELKDRVAFYETKYEGTEEKERVLVDHTNSLAERLKLTSLSEEHLATKLAKLETTLKEKDAALEQAKAKSEEDNAAMQKQMEKMAKDFAKAEADVNKLTLSLAKKNDECNQMEKQFNRDRELFEKQVEASKECLMELIAISKEDKKTFEQDSKELRQQLVAIQAELQKANQSPNNLDRQLEDRLTEFMNAREVNKDQRRPVSPKKKHVPYVHQKHQVEIPTSPRKYVPQKQTALDYIEEYTETYKAQSRDDEDLVSLDSDIDTAALGDLSPEQQEALLNLDLSGSTKEVASSLRKVPGLTENQVTLLLQVASSLAT